MADYHSLLMRAVANLPNAGTPASRGAIYERARKALLEQLRSLRPPLPEGDITREETALDAAIAEIEERYGPQDPAPPLASPPTIPPIAGKPVAAPRPASPPPPPQFSTVQRPSAPAAPGPAAPSARAPSQPGAPSPTRGRSHTSSGCGAAASAADTRKDPAGRNSAASANPGCGEAGHSGADGGVAGSIPAGCRNGQPALPHIADRTGRSAGGGDGRQG